MISTIFLGKFEITTPLIIFESELTSYDNQLIDLGLITLESNQESRRIVKAYRSEYLGLSEPDLYTLVLDFKLG